MQAVPPLHTFAAFALASLIFAVIPGPAVLYIVTRSVSQSRRAGSVSALGTATGNLVYVVAAAFGLSALLASSVLAFTTVRFAGAAYLIYLGIRRLVDASSTEKELSLADRSMAAIYRDGVVVAVLNPKAALFFLSFLPQFIDPSRGSVTEQVILLGTMLITITAVSDCAYALAAGSAAGYLRNLPWSRRLRLVTGSVFIGLGVYAALTGSRSAKAV
jgi:threonine/homoserine/homoserine lactone efflux protein